MLAMRLRCISAASAGSSGASTRCFGFRSKATPVAAPPPDDADPELLRPLIEYDRLVGGHW